MFPFHRFSLANFLSIAMITDFTCGLVGVWACVSVFVFVYVSVFVSCALSVVLAAPSCGPVSA